MLLTTEEVLKNDTDGGNADYGQMAQLNKPARGIGDIIGRRYLAYHDFSNKRDQSYRHQSKSQYLVQCNRLSYAIRSLLYSRQCKQSQERDGDKKSCTKKDIARHRMIHQSIHNDDTHQQHKCHSKFNAIVRMPKVGIDDSAKNNRSDQ